MKIDAEDRTFNAFRGCSGLFDRSEIFSIKSDKTSQVRQIIDLVQDSKGSMYLKVFPDVSRSKYSSQDAGYWLVSTHIIVNFSSSDNVHLDPSTIFEALEEFIALLPFHLSD